MEHQQWMYWSKSLAKELLQIKALLKIQKTKDSKELIDGRIKRWKTEWKPYSKLNEDIKEHDRVWADKILDNLPFKCPMYQCGGIMVTTERPYPKGKNEDDFPDGMVGDSQSPDLVCTNCKAVYRLKVIE